MPEAKLRHTAAMGMWWLAVDSGVSSENELYAWAKRGITIAQRIYNQHARKINSQGFMSRFGDLLGQYAYISYINFLHRLDEMNYQALSVGTIEYLKQTFFHQMSRLGYPSIQVMLADVNGYKTRSVRQSKEGQPIFENALAKVIRQLMVVSFLTNLNGIVSGFTRMANPVYLVFYQMIMFVLAYSDDDPDTKAEVKDLVYILNLYMQLYFGLGSGILYNMPVNYMVGGENFGIEPEKGKFKALMEGARPRIVSKYGDGGLSNWIFDEKTKFTDMITSKQDFLDWANKTSQQMGFFNLKSIQWYDDPDYIQMMKGEVKWDQKTYMQIIKALSIPGYTYKKDEDLFIKTKIDALFEKGLIAPQNMMEYQKYLKQFKFKEVTPLNELFK